MSKIIIPEGVEITPTKITDSVPDDEMAEWRMLAQLAFNGWPDTFQARAKIAEVEKLDPSIAAAWDRVIEAILTAEIYDGVAG